MGEDGGGDLTDLQCEAIKSCHNESPCTMSVC
jgi:hypothetical protein